MQWKTVVLFGILALSAAAEGRREIDLSGPGWKLWQDQAAAWKEDELFLPPVDLAKLPVNPPTGGWGALDSPAATGVAVPGTAEEYLQKVAGPEGDIAGVTWWVRSVRAPESASPRRLLVRFESMRMRAEIYVNRKLAGYDLIGNTPVEVDLSEIVRPGETFQLAVRITDPGGNFDWHDTTSLKWGRYQVALSHGFGGITGRVKLISCDPVYVDDLYVQNTPAITQVNAQVTIRDSTASEVRRDVVVRVVERANPATEIFRTVARNVKLVPGANFVPIRVSVPGAKVWDLEHPDLYVCEAALGQDSDRRTFGFRWFEPAGFGKDAVFRLNGRRIVLRSAISWGFWPINGIYATPEMAEKQVRTAKEMGLNMLNFHRAIGSPVVLEKADELGLLYYEEPGAYRGGDGAPFAHAMLSEKLMRMVRRDRNHPSLVLYSMSNEIGPITGKTLETHRQDLENAHRIDPSRTILHTSAWASGKDLDDTSKMHMRPFDDAVHMNGWYDFHHAGGPPVWDQGFYKSPKEFYNLTDNTGEVVFWGEEGAISTPPRLEKIKADLDAAPHPGWDGGMYLDWYKEFASFLSRKSLRPVFPTVDAITTAMGNVSMEHQGRKIETIRMSNVADGYAINGWEAEILENHSGIVDCFRNPKGDPRILAYYNQPLYVAVKVRRQVVEIPGEVLVDFYAINERDLKGPHTLRILAKDPAGEVVFQKEAAVTLTGGEVYGQLLTEGIGVRIAGAGGKYRIEASLVDRAGHEQARGRDEVLGVDWKSARLGGQGAVWEAGSQIRGFLKGRKGLDVPVYQDRLGRLDWVVVARPPQAGDLMLVPADQLRDAAGNPGLAAIFFNDQTQQQVHRRLDGTVNLAVADGATPDPAVPLTNYYSVRWEGQLIPPATGTYTLAIQASGIVALTVNGRALVSETNPKGRQELRGKIDLEAGKPVPIVLEYHMQRGGARCKFMWSVPERDAPHPQALIERARRDGTTLLILDHAEAWMDMIRRNTSVTYGGPFKVGATWLGGQHIVKRHPLFQDLPVDQALNWPYQAVVRNGPERTGLILEGEELVVGAYHSYPMRLGTEVGVISCGKGRIVFSTLDVCDNLAAPEGPADVARKLFCNFIQYAGAR